MDIVKKYNCEEIQELEEKLFNLYRIEVDRGFEELKENERVNFAFHSCVMDLVWDYLITRKEGEISIEKKSIPQKTDYNIPGKPVVAGHPMGIYELNRERFYSELGNNLERWRIAYNAFTR
ncbi:hypothetical protein HOC35_07415 [Candidatus Woesearchaeota archaeon]|nr:hypothetical protein [Candidatus Woesearchaeota archaeon]